jgi:hypothetical protein
MTDTAYYVRDDEGGREPFWTYDRDRAVWYAENGHRVTGVTGERPHTADL